MKPPVWQDDHIYAAPDCPAIDADFQRVSEAMKRLQPLLDELPKTNDINALRHLLRAIRACWREVRLLEWNWQTYGYNRLSRDGRDEAARLLLSRGQQLQASLAQLCKPVALFWVRAPEEQVRALLQDPELFELAYAIRHDRRQRDQWLSLESEQLIAGLSVDGLQGWGEL
ncbi:peptidase M3, partial [Aeromonas dhakensis]